MPKSTGVTSAAALLRRRPAPLVVSASLAELLRRALKRCRQPDWPPVSTPETFSLVEWCAVHKGCIGVTLQLPGETWDPSLNVIPLERFGLVSIGVIWREPASPAHVAGAGSAPRPRLGAVSGIAAASLRGRGEAETGRLQSTSRAKQLSLNLESQTKKGHRR